jgi:hypothetical protein
MLQTLLTATREIMKAYASITKEDDYRKECKNALKRAFALDDEKTEMLMYVSE